MIQISEIKFRWRSDHPLVINVPKLSVGKGEHLFLTGPSGSGKSTFLSLLGGMIAPESGDIFLNTKNIVSMNSKDRDTFRADHLGILFQMFNLVPFLSILRNVTLPCSFSAARRARAIEKSGSVEREAGRILWQMGLDAKELGERPVNYLSAGEQQRVAVARALLGRPDIIIADEPTSALDYDARDSFLELLFNEVKNTGATLVFVSHDKSLSAYFDRAISLNDINLIA